MSEGPRIQFPHRTPGALRSLTSRFAIAVGIIVLIGLMTWLGRDGYSDADGTPISLLDAFYYATVTVTTTGYGDIAPVAPAERAVTAFVVTPLRIVFLIVLVGTTLELLTERFRRARAQSNWRSRVNQHTVVVGYGTMGRGAVEALLAGGSSRDDVVVVDRSAVAVAAAGEAGLVGIVADATRTSTWSDVRLELARAVVVTCNRDDTAALVTLTARELNASVPISVVVREAENAHLLAQSGATTVVLSSEAAGRLVGMSTQAPRAIGVLEDLLVPGAGLEITERVVESDEVGGPPDSRRGSGLPIAIVRGTDRISFDDPEFARCEAGDIVVTLSGAPRTGRPAPAPSPAV
jgi:voltage-gated potassium channel